MNISEIDDNIFMEVAWIRYNSVIFKPKYVIISNADENNLSFGIMTHIILKNREIIYVIYKKCATSDLDTHFKAYKIKHHTSSYEIYTINIPKKCNVRTCNFHIPREDRCFVSMFDV